MTITYSGEPWAKGFISYCSRCQRTLPEGGQRIPFFSSCVYPPSDFLDASSSSRNVLNYTSVSKEQGGGARRVSPPYNPAVTSARRALKVSRARIFLPMAAWIGTSNICRGMTLSVRINDEFPRSSIWNPIRVRSFFTHCRAIASWDDRCTIMASASTGFAFRRKDIWRHKLLLASLTLHIGMISPLRDHSVCSQHLRN